MVTPDPRYFQPLLPGGIYYDFSRGVYVLTAAKSGKKSEASENDAGTVYREACDHRPGE